MKQLAAIVAIALGSSVVALAHAGAQDPQPPSQPQQQQQQQPPPPPTFRTTVDLVPVDVNIVDKTGRPVMGLGPSDFQLMVDGKPRRIVSAEYIAASREGAPPPEKVTHYSTNASAAGGRLIMIAVDQGNIGRGRGKLALEAASQFLARLTPADRVGLVALPGAGPQIDFTSNHALIRSILPKLVGMATPDLIGQGMGASDAIRFLRGDPQATAEVIDRECGGYRTPAEVEMCRNQVMVEARSVAGAARERTRNSLLALRSLIERLATTNAPKTIVLISEGLTIDREYGDLSWVGPAAARGQVALYVLQLDQPTFDASTASPSSRLGRASNPTRSEDIQMGEEGLSLLAGMARGTVMRVVSNANYAFSRLALELSGYYLLSFEPEALDRDGKPHKIKIQVPGRSGVEIRARSEFVVDSPGTARTDEAVLADTLRTPLMASDIGLKVSAYTMRDGASRRPRVLMVAEIDRSLNADEKLSIAYALVDSSGKLVASQIDANVKTPIRPATRTQVYVGAALAEAPGVHTLKLAVLDSRGKRGSVEHTFRAQLATAGQIRATDLLIAENAGAAGGVVPAVSGEFTSDVLHGYLELYSDAAAALNNASVVLEIADSEQGRALDSAAARLQPPSPDTPDRRTAEAAVPIALLPPGEYVARAVISIGNQKAGQVVRPFRLARSAANVTAPGEGSTLMKGTGRPIPFISRIDAFDRKSVLAPEVVGFFLDRMTAAPARGAAGAPAFGEARAGRFEEAATAATGADNQVAAAFLQGLASYSRGDLEPAAGKFREALRLDSTFFPAAFYLGSCFAAGGRDREAVGAWQTSLVTESDAPFIYTLLGDALLRLKDTDAALDILTEASTLWPGNDEVLMRLGTAQMMAGRLEEALKTLEGYLARNPSDHERHFVALRALYEARAKGRSIRSPEEDRALFDRYAAAYAAANGPQQAMVDQWRKFINR